MPRARDESGAASRPEGARQPRRESGLAGEDVEIVRVLDEDPELGRHLASRALASASAAATAPLLRRDEGPTSFVIDEPAPAAHLGLLVLDGVIVRHLSFGQIGTNEFLGPGDLIRPWIRGASRREIAQVRWEVLAPARLAVLDPEFANRVCGWPEITAALLDRAAERADSQALQAALHQAKHVEDRVLLALWHFAGRWGQSGPEGRTITLHNITGEILARFVGARRQAVSSALGQLTDSGAIKREPDGRLILPAEPPQLNTITPGRDRKLSARDRSSDSLGADW
jgi:hypothetical protein